MKADLCAIAFGCALLCFMPIQTKAQSRPPLPKRTFTYDEVRQLCGLKVDAEVRATAMAKADSVYTAYLQRRNQVGPLVVTPNWRSMMSPVEDQDTDWCASDCWAHASTGVTEGRLHILWGSNIGINLDETEIVRNVLGYCDGNSITAGLDYIKNDRVQSQVGSFPNYQGAAWSLLSRTQWSGPDGVESAVDYGPVTAGFDVYQDFVDFFNIPGNATAVYQHTGGGKPLGSHAVVIVGYDDAGQYWLCKNSWGTGWADAGYFRIHFDTGLHFTGIDSYSNYSVSEDQSCYAKIVPNLITSLSTALSYSFWSEGNEVVYVLGNTTTSNDATVPANATLQLSPGVTVQAASGKMIIIDGQINAQGTVSQTITFDRNGSSGSWYGLVLQSGSTGIVNLCHFNNATVGVTCNSSSPTISNSVFRNDYFGIYCNPCTPTISGNDIQYCSNSGIYLTGASPAISSNTLSNNSSYGIFCHNTSDPSLSGNTMAGNGTAGLYCEYYSSPYLALPAFSGNNVIANNSVYGIETYSYSNPVLGTGQARGYNSMFSNSSYDVAEFSNCTVSAQYNWWGVYPANPSRFYLSGSTLDYSNALSYNPNPGRPKVGVQGVSPVLAGPTSDSTFNLAFNYALIQAYDDAIRLYLEVFGKAPMGSFLSREALVFLAEAYERSGRTDFLGCLENQIAPRAVGNIEMSIIVQELEGHWLVKAGQYSDAVAIYRELHEKFASSPEVDKFAIFNIGEISYLYLNDHASAVESFGLFKNMYPNDPLAPVAALLMSADLSATPQKGAAPSSSPRPLPTSFSLESNYPNPFNPSTQITYSLSKTGKVSLMIFDILGREIATLADGYQQPGQYTVTWNALKSGGNVVSSGVYLARLEVFSELGAIDFTKTIRLLLLK